MAAFALGTRLGLEDTIIAIFVMILGVLLIPVVLFVGFARPARRRCRCPARAGGALLPERRARCRVMPCRACTRRAAGASRRERRSRAAWHDARWPGVQGPPLYVRLFGLIRDLFVGTSLAALLAVAARGRRVPHARHPGHARRRHPRPGPAAPQMTRDFGFSRWPQFMRGIAGVVAWGAMLTAAVVLIVSRRGTYGMHILRGVAGVAMFGLAAGVPDAVDESQRVGARPNVLHIDLPNLVLPGFRDVARPGRGEGRGDRRANCTLSAVRATATASRRRWSDTWAAPNGGLIVAASGPRCCRSC